MKKKVLLKSVAVMMSAFTLSPSFGNVAFAMKRNKGQETVEQESIEEKNVNAETVIIFNELVKIFTYEGKANDISELKTFCNRVENDSLMKPYLNGDRDWKNMNNIEKNRAAIYAVVLAYLIEKNCFHFEVKKGNVYRRANMVRDAFIILDTALKIFFNNLKFEKLNPVDDLYNLRTNLFKKNGKQQKQNYTDPNTLVNTYQDLIEKENSLISLLIKFNKLENESKSIFKYNNVQDAYEILFFVFTEGKGSRGWTDYYNVDVVFNYLFKLFRAHVNKEPGYNINFDLVEKKLGRHNDNLDILKLVSNILKECEKEKKRQALVEQIKQQQPEVEARNAAQEKEREEEKERSRNTKPNKPTGDVIFQNLDNINHLSDEEKEEEAYKKAEGRKQAKEIEINQQKEKEKEKEKEIQERQEEIEQQRERKKLPSDCLGVEKEEISKILNNIFTEKSKGVSIKANNYTKIFTAGEDGVVNTVYFPFYLLNNRINRKYGGKSNFIKDVKCTIYNISRLNADKFKDLSIVQCAKDATMQQFLSGNFNENAKKCFSESGVNSKKVNVYKFTPAGSLNNKDRIAFVKKGNVILVFDFLGHIDGGEK